MKESYLCATIFILTLWSLSGQGTSADDSNNINPSWIKPDPWSRHEYEQRKKEGSRAAECQCPPVPDCNPLPAKMTTTETNPIDENNRLAMTFYKKFVTRMFADLLVQQDSNFLLSRIQLKITQQQLVDLRGAKNARKIDELVTTIVEQSKESMFNSAMESFCWSLESFYRHFTENTYFLYLFVSTIGLLIAWFLVRGISRIMQVHPGIVVFLMFILISYVITFKQCNQKLEVNAMAKLRRTDGSNPCEKRGEVGKVGGLFGFISEFLGKDRDVECLTNLQGMDLTCDPSAVFIEMVAKLQLQYFQTFVTEMIEVFKVSTKSSGIIESVLIAGFILGLIYLLVTNGLKYGLYGGANFLSSIVNSRRANSELGPNSGQPALEQQQQGPYLPTPAASLIPPSIKFNITVGRGGRRSRVETNRIEEIADSIETKPPPRAAVKQSGESPKKEDDGGSGDAPKVGEPLNIDPATVSDSDGEEIEIACQIPTVGTDEAETGGGQHN